MAAAATTAGGATARTTDTQFNAFADQFEKEFNKRNRASTANDGRADGKLAKSTDTSPRSKQIAQLRAESDAATTEAAALLTNVDTLVSESASLARMAATSTDAAIAFPERVKQLQAANARATERLAVAQRLTDELQTQSRLNLISNAAQVTGMAKTSQQVLDGSGPIKLQVSAEGAGGQARYDRTQRSIVVDPALLASLDKSVEYLQLEGIVDQSGRILDQKRFDESAAGDNVLSAASIIGVREATHAAQDARGLLEKTDTTLKATVDGIVKEARASGSTAALETVVTVAIDSTEPFRISEVELSAYQNQEIAELQAGLKKSGFVSIDDRGKRLKPKEAIANIIAFESGNAMEFGSSKGKAYSGVANAWIATAALPA